MKKVLLSFSFIACLMLLSAIPAFANNMNYSTNTPATDIKNDVNRGINDVGRGINDVGRAIGTELNPNNYNYKTTTPGYTGTNMNSNNYRTNTTGYNGTNVHANNYRAKATGNNGSNWGWLGLIGLFGLAGMRSRGRDGDRA